MAIAFPVSLDALNNPTAAGKMNASPSHAAQHADANDAIEALQVKVGIDSSAVATCLDYLRPKRLFSHHGDAGNTTTVETDLYSDTVTAGRLGVNDEVIQAQYSGLFVLSATATRTLRVYFGGTAIFDSGALGSLVATYWIANVTIIRVSSTVVRYAVSLVAGAAGIGDGVTVGEVTGLTLSNTNILKIAGQAGGTGAATDDIVAKFGTVDWKAAA